MRLHLSVQFLFNRWFLLYSVFLHSHRNVSMSGLSGSDRVRGRGRIICPDIKNARNKKSKEQVKTRCLDQFFLPKTNPDSDNGNANPAAYNSENHSEMIDSAISIASGSTENVFGEYLWQRTSPVAVGGDVICRFGNGRCHHYIALSALSRSVFQKPKIIRTFSATVSGAT